MINKIESKQFFIEGEVFSIAPTIYENEYPGIILIFPNGISTIFPLYHFNSEIELKQYLLQQIEYYAKKIDYQDDDFED